MSTHEYSITFFEKSKVNLPTLNILRRWFKCYLNVGIEVTWDAVILSVVPNRLEKITMLHLFCFILNNKFNLSQRQLIYWAFIDFC